MMPVIYKYLVGKNVEVCVTSNNGRKYWYHGKLLNSTLDGVEINDKKLGRMIIGFPKILYVREYNEPLNTSK